MTTTLAPASRTLAVSADDAAPGAARSPRAAMRSRAIRGFGALVIACAAAALVVEVRATDLGPLSWSSPAPDVCWPG